MNESNTYLQLIDKLNAFIKKYYLNKLLRGVLLWIGLVFFFYLVINLLEYQFWFNTGMRKVLFYGFLVLAIGTGIKWLVIPMLKYFNLSEQISKSDAAIIIGKHFPEVQDKLLNVLQLKEQADQGVDNSLLLASIEQKTANMQLINFPTAIDLGKNRKYLKYALPPLLLLLLLIIAAPNIITHSTERLIHNNREYEKPAPFKFLLSQKDLKVVQFSDISLDVRIEGKYFPEEVQIIVDGYPYTMRKDGPNKFHHEIKNIQADERIQFQAGEVKSRPYLIEVIGKPSIESFKIQLDYPAYIGKKDEVIKNTGDVVVPVGTKLNWIFSTLNTDKLTYHSTEFKSDSVAVAEASPNVRGEYEMQNRAMRHENITFYVSGNNLMKADSVTYGISTIPDNYPIINVEKFRDSSLNSPIFFVGEARDDYGISDLFFRYFIIDAQGNKGELHSRKIAVKRGLTVGFDDVFKVGELDLQPGEQVNFYFQVYDNDAVNGHKSSRTQIMSIAKPTMEEYEQQEEENEKTITSNLEEAFKQNKELKKNIEKLRNKLLSQQEVTWQDKKMLEELLKMQEKIQEKIKKAQEKYKENLENQKEFDKPSEEMKKKQEQLKELFKEAQEKSEIQKMLEKLRKLMQELNKDQSLNMVKQMKSQQSEQDLELDRLKELYKTLEVERDIQQEIEKLKKLAEKQEKLSKETQKSDAENKENQEKLENKQEKLNDEFNKIKKEMKDIMQRNKQLAQPKDLGNPKQKMYNIQQDMNKSQQGLQQNKNGKASDKMKDAADKMRKMAEQMKSRMAQGNAQQMQMNLKALRQLLENLVTISFNQEDLINDFQNINIHTPLYVKKVQGQFKVKEDFAMVEDSLRALSKRVLKLESYIMEKVREVNDNMEESLSFLEERKVGQASNHQHRIMKSLNDLAVMLSETMENIQMQMSKKMPGSQMCNKPKPGSKNPGSKGKVPMNKITQGQKKLSEKMKKMAQQNRKKSKNGKKNGMTSEEFAKLAKQQAQLRKMLEEYNESLREQGNGQKKLQEIINKMNKMETNLVNKRLTAEMLKRQQDIVTRLLEAENAERQRKMSKKRKAETAENHEKEKIPPAMAEYLQERKNEIEVLKRVSPSLQPFYKALVDEYYQSLRN